jgi:lipopolysaccharide heptosyltransferase II
MNRILILKKLDAVIGRMATMVLPGSPKSDAPHCRKFLVIRPGGIGDAVLLIPVLQQLKDAYPEAMIEVLAEQRNAAIFGMCTAVDRVLRYDQGGILAVLGSRYDVIIDSEQWHRLTAVVARLTRAQMRIGYGSNERRKLFSHAIDYSHADYELDSFFALLEPLGVARQAVVTPFLIIPSAERDRVSKLLQDFSDRPFIALFPGSSITERRWGVERFHQLSRRLNGDGYPVVVIGGSDDRSAGDAIAAGLEGLNLAGQTSLLGSAAIIANSALLVSGDSGVLHLGVGLGTLTVSLFGPGIAAKWAPRGEQHIVVNHKLPCSPCTRFGTTPSCPIGAKCIQDITVDEVFMAAQELLNLK